MHCPHTHIHGFVDVKNVCVLGGAAYPLLKHFESGGVSEVYVNFPEPPGDRDDHSDKHMLNPSFMRALSRVIAQNGTLTIVTDNLSYLRKLIRELKEVQIDRKCLYVVDLPAGVQSDKTDPAAAKGLPEGYSKGTSYFDRFW